MIFVTLRTPNGKFDSLKRKRSKCHAIKMSRAKKGINAIMLNIICGPNDAYYYYYFQQLMQNNSRKTALFF